MCRRERNWTGAIVCAGALLLAGWAFQGPGVAWAAEGGHEGGLVSLDRSLIVQVVNFLILLVILQRLLYKPFLAKMRSGPPPSRSRSRRRRPRAPRPRVSRRRTRRACAPPTPRRPRSAPRP